MKPSVHQVTLLRSNPVSPPGERLRVERIASLPVTASSDTSVDAGVRRIANDLTQEHPHLAWQEVVVHVVDSRAGRSTSPAVLVADHSFPIAICLYADAATILIDLEADDVSVNRRFRLIREYVASLVHFGYARTCDDDAPVDAAVISNFLADAEAQCRRRGSRFNRWVVFVTTSVLVAIGSFATLPPRHRSVWLLLGMAPVLALLMVGLQYVVDRLELSVRLRAFRDELSVQPADSEAMHFRARRNGPAELAIGLFFGGLTFLSVRDGMGLETWVLAVATVWVAAYSLLMRNADVKLDVDAVEGLGTRGRCRIPFTEVDRIPFPEDPSPCFVAAVDRGRIWMSKQLPGYERLLEELWRRADMANRVAHQRRDPEAHEGAIPAESGRAITIERMGTFSRGDVLRRPLWLLLMRRHPLRGQYGWQRHLLARGRVVLAHVVTAHPGLLERGPHGRSDALPALVVFSTNPQWSGGVPLSRAIAEIMGSEPDERPSGPAPPEDTIGKFRRELGRHMGMPLLVPVPALLGGPSQAYCTTLMINPSQMPFGYLRSLWLPILVAPDDCRFAIVLPLRQWDAQLRRTWKSGANV